MFSFKKERGVGAVANSFPDFELSFMDPAIERLAGNAEASASLGSVQDEIGVHHFLVS